MGLKQKSDAGQKNCKDVKTDVGEGETVTPDTTPPPEEGKPLSTYQRLDALKAILGNINAPPQIWPREALKATLRKFERVPRNGWDQIHKFYTEKFAGECSLHEFKRRAELAVAS